MTNLKQANLVMKPKVTPTMSLMMNLIMNLKNLTMRLAMTGNKSQN